MIGRLQRVALREVWKHEALDFTRWLVENPDVLSDVIGRQLVNLAREQSAGAFSVDVTGETSAGEVVVIENQLERSDHDHLGKLVTYVAALGARLGVWIVADPRPEHIGAVKWLNEAGTAAFFLLKLEAVRIGESAPAPLLTLITGPSEEALEVGETKKELAARHIERQEFWRALLSAVKGGRGCSPRSRRVELPGFRRGPAKAGCSTSSERGRGNPPSSSRSSARLRRRTTRRSSSFSSTRTRSRAPTAGTCSGGNAAVDDARSPSARRSRAATGRPTAGPSCTPGWSTR